MADGTVFQSPQGIDWHGDVGLVNYGGGDKTMVTMFYTKPLHNPSKSLAEGRQIFEDCVYVRIHPPGERLNIIDRPSTTADQRRWPMQWMQFKQNQQQIPDGTPIEQLYPESKWCPHH